jgi:hypothetical protein
MLENNPPRNNQPETHRDDEAGDGVCIVPGPLDSHRSDSREAVYCFAAIDFPMPEKTHPVSRRAAASLCCMARWASNSAGGR